MRRLVVVSILGALLLFGSPACAKEAIKLGVVTKPGSAQNMGAEKFKEYLESRSNYSVEIFHSASLGNETQILEKIRENTVQMGVITAGPFDQFVPEVRATGYPFMFANSREADLVLDGPVGRELLKSLEKAQFKGLAFAENGFRHLTNNIRPVHAVKDVKGLKIRVMESELHKRLWLLLGASPKPLGWPINAKLSEGVVDGQENPLWPIWNYKLYEVQKYLSLTGHVYSALISVANLKWFEGLPAGDQRLIRRCMVGAAKYQRSWARRNEAGFLAKLKDAGMVVNEHPDLASFRARAAGMRELEIFRAEGVRKMLDAFLDAVSAQRSDLK